MALVHWKAEEIAERAVRLEAAGYEVIAIPAMSPAVLTSLKIDRPAAFVIDLSRLPSHGRRLGEITHEQRPLRGMPIVFVGGAPEKVARVRQALPDAVYTTWARVETALARAMARPPSAAPAARPLPSGYSGTPVPRKLGIKPGAVVALIDAPDDVVFTLGVLPDGVVVRRDLRRAPDLAVFFMSRRRALGRVLRKVTSVLDAGGGAWVAWPKKTSGVQSDLAEPIIRAEAIRQGLVDFKVCAIDATWSGLRLAKRRTP